MTLEELKAQWDAAIAAAAAAPDNAELKAAVETAKAAYDAEASKGSGDGLDESKWDEKTKAYIAKLRGESATHRNKNKDLASKLKTSDEQKKAILKAAGIEDESEKPEEIIKTLSSTSEQLAFDNAILESALQNGIPSDRLKYFKYLVADAAAALAEGEELSEEKLLELVAEAKKTGGKANTSVDGAGGGKGSPNPNSSGAVTLDQFCRMTMVQKGDLYGKNPDLYATLLAEAKAKKRLV